MNKIINYCTIICILIMLLIIYNRLSKLSNVNNELYKNYSYYDCYLNLYDINPQFIKAFEKHNGKIATSGYCKNAKIYINAKPCETDKCKPTSTLLNSKGNTIDFPLEITPEKVVSYFNFTK